MSALWDMTSYRLQCIRNDVSDDPTGYSEGEKIKLLLKVSTCVRIYIVSCRKRWKISIYLNASR